MPRKEKKYHFIYKTTCSLTKRYYYGMHSTDNLKDSYLGSGREITRSIKKYGRENHSIERLEFYKFRKKLKEREAEIVNEDLINNPLCMNLAKGGGGENYKKDLISVKDSKGNTFSVHKNDPRYLSGELKHVSKNMVTVLNGGKCFNVSKNDPRYLSGELKHVHKGKVTVKNKDGIIFHVAKNDPRYLTGELVGMNKGLKMSFERIKKIKDSLKGNNTKELNSQFGTCWITNGNENKKIKKEDKISNGWKLGRKIK